MKAVVQGRYGSSPDVLELREIDRPVVGDDEVLVRVHAAFYVAGSVATVDESVTLVQPGDEVFGTCRSSFAEYASARADRLLPKPANFSFEQAAAVAISGNAALQALATRRTFNPVSGP